MSAPKPWTLESDAVLRARYVADGPTVCSALLGRTPHVRRRSERCRRRGGAVVRNRDAGDGGRESRCRLRDPRAPPPRLLRDAAASGDARVPAKPRGFRKHWRIPSVLVDEFVTAYRRRESLAAATLRIGVNRATLHTWLTRAGIPVVRAAKLDPDAVDRVVAARLADPRCKAPRRAA